ncbi:MAG: GNAT family N-acetyltransferase [Actinomycetota bacterium]
MKIRDRKFAKLSTDELHDILKLRIDVFVVEQECAYPELDGRDTEPGTRHVWIADDLGVVAYVRVLDDDDAIRVGRVATREDARSGGFAGALMEHVLDSTDGPWVLEAQSYLAGWYRKRGFADDGDEYVEDGIPHIPMRRDA